MKFAPDLPQDHVFWYLMNHDINPPLRENITADVVIVGGGMTGLSAAQTFALKGYRVVIVEKNYCGSGASGKSSGFITPDSELSLSKIMHSHGKQAAQQLWKLVEAGSNLIRTNIAEYNLTCDYQIQDSLILAHTARAFSSDIINESETRKQFGYASTVYSKEALPHIIATDQYHGGISYGNTFGIHSYAYIIGMKRVLQQLGVTIYEESPAIAIEDNVVTTPMGRVRAEHILVCTDRFSMGLESLRRKVYHVQTFLSLSAPLTDTQARALFPDQRYMVWDTSFIYSYYRLDGENRLMLGGANLFNTYDTTESHNNKHVARQLNRYIKQVFPQVAIQIEYIWPGFIGIAKDIFPIMGYDQDMKSVYYIVAPVGLPWAAALGQHAYEHIVNHNDLFDRYFSPYRSFKIGGIAQTLLGTRMTFAWCNLLAELGF
jgi:gamma-glutamylputrescine oxidase